MYCTYNVIEGQYIVVVGQEYRSTFRMKLERETERQRERGGRGRGEENEGTYICVNGPDKKVIYFQILKMCTKLV